MKKKPEGRPTKFKEEYCDMVIEHMALGYSFESFAGVVKVNQDTLHHWCKLHPLFSEAKSIAFEQSRLFWEKSAIDNLIEKPMHQKINNTLWIFNMKNRFGWRDSVEIESNENITINVKSNKK